MLKQLAYFLTLIVNSKEVILHEMNN